MTFLMIWDFVFFSETGEDVEHYSINNKTKNMNKRCITPHTRSPKNSCMTNKPLSTGVKGKYRDFQGCGTTQE